MAEFYIDTANFEQLDKAYKTGLFKGITTNASIIKKENKPRFEVLKEISTLKPDILFAQVIGDTYEERVRDFYSLLEFCNNHEIIFGPKIPVDMIGLNLIAHIVGAHPELDILGTAIYSADQAILATQLGCHYLAPYYNRMMNENIDANKELRTMRNFIDNHGHDTKILCASFKNSKQVMDALENGSHCVTLPYDVFESMINKKLATQAIEVFNRDGRV